VAEHERVITTQSADPYLRLTHAGFLTRAGRFDDAVALLRHRPHGPEPLGVPRDVQAAERTADLARRLPGLDDGTFRPNDLDVV
jgi:hypothetical protein